MKWYQKKLFERRDNGREDASGWNKRLDEVLFCEKEHGELKKTLSETESKNKSLAKELKENRHLRLRREEDPFWNVKTRLEVLAIEKDLLVELKRRDQFYDTVTEVFLRQERRVDFFFYK